jgi:hypothetical protein
MGQARRSESSETSRSGKSSSQGNSKRAKEDSAKKQTQTGITGEDLAGLPEQGRQAVGQAQEQAGKLAGIAREQATSQLTTQKERAAGSLGTLAMALHDASRQMREQDGAVMADPIDTAAIQLDRLAGMLKDQDINQMISAAEQFARRQPALFLAAAFAVGFAGTRFLRSSSPSSAGQRMGMEAYRPSWERPDGPSTDAFGSRFSPSGGEADFSAAMRPGTSGQAGFATAAGSDASGEWQGRANFASGPEGQ